MKIVSLSPTQIESFDPTTPFGCSRRWWFERVGGRDKGPISGGDLGTAVHSTLEAFLLGGPQGGLHDLVIGAPGALEWLLALRPRIVAIERKIEIGDLALAGIPITGRIDWIAKRGDGGIELGDHKTTSDIGRYAKTKQGLKDSTQMNIYAMTLGDLEEGLTITQDFYQTKKKKAFEAISVETTKPEIASRILKIEAVVEEMVKVSQMTKPEDVSPNTAVCNIGFGCIHRAYCKRSGEFNMASLLDAFSKVSAAPAVPPADPPSVAQHPLQSALPPDAPKSDPALAADPPKTGKLVIQDVPSEALDEPESKPRGRPKGSQNKPKDLTAPIIIAEKAQDKTAPTEGPVKVERITIRHGAKIGMPNFSSALVEVEYSGLVTGSVQAAREALSLQCKLAMTAELEVYTKAPEKK